MKKQRKKVIRVNYYSGNMYLGWEGYNFLSIRSWIGSADNNYVKIKGEKISRINELVATDLLIRTNNF